MENGKRFEPSEVILQAISDGYWDWNLKTNEVFYSKEWKAMLGYTEEDFATNSLSVWDGLVHPDDREAVYQMISDHIHGKTPFYSSEQRLRCKNGNYKWVLDRGRVIEWNAAGEPSRMIGTHIDIDTFKQMETKIASNEQRFRTIVEDQGEQICRYYPDGTITFANAAYGRFVGEAPEALTGQSIYRFVFPEDITKLQESINALTEENPFLENENRALRGDGQIRWTRWRNHLLASSLAGVTEIQSVGEDITDARNLLTQTMLRRKFEQLVSTLIARFTSYKPDTIDEIINQALAEVGEALQVDRAYVFRFDLEKDTMSNTHEWCADGIEPEIDILQNLPLDSFPWWVKQLREKKQLIVRTLDDFPADASIERAVLEAQGIQSLIVIPVEVLGRDFIGFMGFDAVKQARDWDEDLLMALKVLAEAIANSIQAYEAEQQIRINEARERLFIESMPALILKLAPDGKVLDFISGLTGVLSKYVAIHQPKVGWKLSEFFPETIADLLQIALDKCNVNEQGASCEFDLDVFEVKATLEAHFANLNKEEAVVVIQDISEKKRLEQQKSDFINNATHEMRTPLTTILLMLDLLEKNNIFLKDSQYWQVLKGEVTREKMLIEQLLSVSRIEKGGYTVSQRNLDLVESIRDAVKILEPQANGKGIAIQLNLPSEPVYVVGDSNAFQVIFTNLLSNAIKFTEDATEIGVDVKVEFPEVKVAFWDHGIGIPEEDLPRIFDRFSRGSNAIADEIQGSGIGLFIVRHLMQTFGGDVSIDSKICAGTRVNLTFPALQKI